MSVLLYIIWKSEPLVLRQEQNEDLNQTLYQSIVCSAGVGWKGLTCWWSHTMTPTTTRHLSAESSRLPLLTGRITDCDYSVDTWHTVTLHGAENSSPGCSKTQWGRCFPLEQLETPEVPCLWDGWAPPVHTHSAPPPPGNTSLCTLKSAFIITLKSFRERTWSYAVWQTSVRYNSWGRTHIRNTPPHFANKLTLMK